LQMLFLTGQRLVHLENSARATGQCNT